jgi:hypothetical protein
VGFTRVIQGQVVSGPRSLPGSAGLDIDTAPVRWERGIAVVLGRENPVAGNATRTETLFAMDPRGSPLGAPRPLSLEVSAAGAGGRFIDLAPAWIEPGADPNAPATTAAARRRQRYRRPLRLLQGSGYWGPQIGPRGVLVRREHEDAQGNGLADLLFTSWIRNAQPFVQRVLGSFWDATPAWDAHGVVVAGLREHPPRHSPDPVIAYGGADRGTLRTFSTRDAQTFDALRDATDIAITSVRDGAVIAWIDGSTSQDPPGHRRLRLARIVCRAAATPTAPGATAPSTRPAPARPAPRRRAPR